MFYILALLCLFIPLSSDEFSLAVTDDPLSRKTAIRSPPFNQQVIDFNAVGNILKMQINGDEMVYTYSDLYQLTSESGLFAHHYAYDSAYNRLQRDAEIYEINALNQIPSHLQYDKNGNPIHHNKATYLYDALDRLKRVETEDCIQTFTYDCLHRYLSKTVIQEGTQKTTYFLYDGQNEIGGLNEEQKVTELRILGEAPHAEIGAAIAIELNGIVHTPIHDLQGNLALLTPVGSEPTIYRYSAFGDEKILGETVSPWRFSSKRTDSQTHLVNFGRRYYIPSLGRWLTPDPAGFADGMNLYAYVHNDPLNHFDEYGLIMTGWDNKTAQQMTRPPWEGERAWSAISHFGRNLASRMTHELYDQCVAPMQRDFDRSVAWFANQTRDTEQKIWDNKLGIDRFFGTNIATADRHSSRLEFAQVGIPFGPGGVMSATKVATAVSKIFRNVGALRPARKLSANINGGNTAAPDFIWNKVKLQNGKISEGWVELRSTLKRIEKNQKYPYRNDGSILKNRENLLPKQNFGYYREFVLPTPGVNGPGPQRIILGRNTEIYYSHNHYQSFMRIK